MNKQAFRWARFVFAQRQTIFGSPKSQQTDEMFDIVKLRIDLSRFVVHGLNFQFGRRHHRWWLSQINKKIRRKKRIHSQSSPLAPRQNRIKSDKTKKKRPKNSTLQNSHQRFKWLKCSFAKSPSLSEIEVITLCATLNILPNVVRSILGRKSKWNTETTTIDSSVDFASGKWRMSLRLPSSKKPTKQWSTLVFSVICPFFFFISIPTLFSILEMSVRFRVSSQFSWLRVSIDRCVLRFSLHLFDIFILSYRIISQWTTLKWL